MKTPVCPRVPLVEALRDGRLGPQESASMARHVPTCAACSAAARNLDAIGDAVRAPRPQATPLEHQRARLALLRRATELAPARAPSWGRLAVLVAAAMALAAALGWTGARMAGPAAAPVALHMPRPPRLTPARETTLRPSNDARFERTRTAGLEVVTLKDGTLDLTVRPLAAGERFVVRTGDAEVEVRGTACRVEADHGKIRSVAVAEGTVELRYAGFSAVIPSGGSWRATGDTAPAPSASPSASAEPAVGAPPSTMVATASKGTKPAGGASPAHAHRPAPEPRAPVARAPEAPAHAPPSPPEVSPASRAFADAMQALRRGDYAGGAAQLETFSTAHAGDPRADEADYLRAIALQRAGHAAEAASAAKQYLARRPAGAHRAEAKQIAGD